MSAAATLAAWTAVCLASGHGGGDNLLRVGKERFVIGEPRKLGNGALVGRIHKHTATGLTDLGGYKIGADGSIVDLPLPMLRHLLREAGLVDTDRAIEAAGQPLFEAAA